MLLDIILGIKRLINSINQSCGGGGAGKLVGLVRLIGLMVVVLLGVELEELSLIKWPDVLTQAADLVLVSQMFELFDFD